MRDPGRRSRLIAGGLLAAIVGLSAWLRWPGFTQGGFASHDVAGMLYEAMLLRDGALPYVDSIELKAPGTFWLAKWLAGSKGTDIARFQVWANLWALATLGVLARIAWRLWGPTAAVVAAGLYALHDAHLDSMDANYVTWAQLPLVAGVGAALCVPPGGDGARSRRRTLAWWVAAGVLTGLATLCKQPAGVGMVAVLGIAAWPHEGGVVSRRARVLAVLAGIVAAHLPIALRYAVAGELRTLWEGYAWNRWGARYISYGGEPWGMGAVREGVLATVHFVVLPLSLAVTAVWPPRDPVRWRQWWGLLLWSLGTLAAAWVGLRFYKGYFLAVSAPLCLWAAAPWGLLGRAARVGRVVRCVLLVPTLLLVLRQGAVLEHQRADRARPHDQGGRVIAKHVRRHSEPGDRIWVWGWHLWDVYPLTGLRSASRVYKSLGLLTPPNDDTWRRPATRLRFSDGPAAQLLLEELRANRPVWIVLGSTVPRGEFEALTQLLREDYVRDRRVRLGRVQFWQRRDRADAERAKRREE
ncbi:ArnT family glycosyltransferase [Paraliomyxa miuraensis]|uniref:ArnT family glycosyltransferase n=1 Tax=Paraliomyxa miuraensis TaxID=376150 RepID=UPI002250461A|nr:glycosyltransferase family 39 protein [Paraliomyxa miuraensis]MCX4244433.1 glycosyltransferase family 39 protein [Paraliomyxa miuraensis]